MREKRTKKLSTMYPKLYFCCIFHKQNRKAEASKKVAWPFISISYVFRGGDMIPAANATPFGTKSFSQTETPNSAFFAWPQLRKKYVQAVLNHFFKLTRAFICSLIEFWKMNGLTVKIVIEQFSNANSASLAKSPDQPGPKKVTPSASVAHLWP